MWSVSSILSFLVMVTSFVSVAPRCYDTGNFTTNSTYAKNRDLTLASLPANASANGGYFTASVGRNSDQVYALAMCRGDHSPDACYRCVNSSIYELMADCPNQKEASAWTGDYCVVHYADHSFFGTLELDPTVEIFNTGNITSNLTEFDTVWESLIKNVVRKASTGSSSLKYATGEADFGVFQRIRSLMQCTPDLSQQDCDYCLMQSASNYESCCRGKQGGVIQKPNCYFRWELYPFYVSKAFTTAPKCYETGNFTTNSTYGENRNLILASLPTNVSANGGFFNDTIGHNSDKVYALGMCRGDSTPLDCYSCVSSTAHDLITNCPNQKEAYSWGGNIQCLVRYADRSFYGILEVDRTEVVNNTRGFTSNLTQFGTIWANLTDTLVRKASAGSSSLKYATGEADFSVFQRIYALMQCIPVFSRHTCNACLSLLVDVYDDCCHGMQGGYVQMPSCFFRWGLYPFYVSNASTHAPSLTPSTPASNAHPTLSPPSIITKPEQKKSIWIPLGASLSAALGLTLFSACGVFIWRRRNIQEDKEDSGEVQLLDLMRGSVPHENSNDNFNLDIVGRSQEFPSMQLDSLQAATNSFCDENKLGQGGFGPVYKGTLADGKEIAVKRLSGTSSQGLLEFKNEVMLIARLQHRNLVRLLGCCLEKNEKLLIYEFMPNKSLDVFLFNSSLAVQLTWQKRFNIIRGTARGIMYLHEDSRLRIIHRDLKASNVLLDHEMNPKISDFGMAKIFGGDQNEANTNRVVGTYGYMAPEYAMEGHFSVKSDVFSFGVLLLEIISGRKNSGFHSSEYGESLLTFVWKLWSKGEAMKLVDLHLIDSSVPSQVLKCVQIGLLCVQTDPVDRPTMSSVVAMLGNDTITLPLPAEPAFYARRFFVEPIQLHSSGRMCSVNEVTISNISPR